MLRTAAVKDSAVSCNRAEAARKILFGAIMKQQRILIVDDNPKNRAIVEELFHDEFEVYPAEEGDAALELAKILKPDVILLDVMMPGMSGYEVCQRVKSDPGTSDIPVIIISAKGRTEEIIEGFESHADDYIVRPFVNSELRARVRAMLRLKQTQDQLKEANQLLQEHARKLEDANERLNELDKLKAGFTAMLVHDLRSPLAVIQVALQMLESRVEPLGPEFSPLVREALVSCNGIFNLTTDLLEGFRAESGVLMLARRSAKVHELVNEPFRHASVLALKKHIEMHSVFPDGLPEVLVDVHKMQRAIANLLGNAVKFTRRGGRVCLDVMLETAHDEAVSSAGQVLIKISDSGEGILDEDLPYVFDPYYQGHSRNASLGSGLGLSIAHRIVAAHGGKIVVQTQLGVGSCFTIHLPILAASASAD
jgi:two-component system sensor histidine kinase/response regulator